MKIELFNRIAEEPVKPSFRARKECGPEVVVDIAEMDHQIAKPHSHIESPHDPRCVLHIDDNLKSMELPLVLVNTP